MRLSPWPSSVLALYQAKTFALRILAFAFVLIGLLQVLDLLTESEMILAAPGNGNAALLHYVKLRLPQLADTFLPFAVLLGSLLTWSSFSQSSEIVIMKGAGMSPHAIMAPMMLTALLVGGLHFAFAQTVLPRTNAELDAWQKADYGAYDPAMPDDRRDRWQAGDTDIVHADRVSGTGAGMVLTDVRVFRRQDDRLVSEIRGTRATYAGDEGWRLEEVRRFDVATGEEVRSAPLLIGRGIDPAVYTVRSPDPDEVNSVELSAAIDRMEATGASTAALRTTWHQKIVKPLSAVLMPLLGAVAGFGLARSGQMFIRSVVGLGLGFAYFVADNAMLAMGQFGAAPPLLAAWGPFLLFLIVGEALIFRTEE